MKYSPKATEIRQKVCRLKVTRKMLAVEFGIPEDALPMSVSMSMTVPDDGWKGSVLEVEDDAELVLTWTIETTGGS